MAWTGKTPRIITVEYRESFIGNLVGFHFDSAEQRAHIWPSNASGILLTNPSNNFEGHAYLVLHVIGGRRIICDGICSLSGQLHGEREEGATTTKSIHQITWHHKDHRMREKLKRERSWINRAEGNQKIFHCNHKEKNDCLHSWPLITKQFVKKFSDSYPLPELISFDFFSDVTYAGSSLQHSINVGGGGVNFPTVKPL